MTISIIEGNIFNSGCETLVNTVNCSGVMGRGIALEFRLRYPQMFDKYVALCQAGKLRPGLLWLYRAEDKTVLNFPTKDSWKSPSKWQYLESGLAKFTESYQQKQIRSIAFPLLGTHNGGLDEDRVLALMQQMLAPLPITVEIYRYRADANDDLFCTFKQLLQQMSAPELAQATGVRSGMIEALKAACEKGGIYQVNQLLNVDGVGERTVIKLFDYLLRPQADGQLSISVD